MGHRQSDNGDIHVSPGLVVFNQDIGQWDISTRRYRVYVLRGRVLQPDIGLWDTSNVTAMSGMFKTLSFNQMSVCGTLPP